MMSHFRAVLPAVMAPGCGGRIAVALSGGVDSAAAAAALQEQGHAVIGITAVMSSESDIRDARGVAAALGIPHHVVDLTTEFRETVFRHFVSEYATGRTPSPCVFCNRLIKFGALMERAFSLGASLFATGHYARVSKEAGRTRLLRGVDAAKDQSYFLFRLTQEQLSRSVFPLGEATRRDTVEFAASRRLPVHDKAKSQELCFVGPEGYAALVETACPGIRRPGAIVDPSGRFLGRHDGVHRFTVGQRRGLGLAAGQPLYVLELKAAENQVVVAGREHLFRSRMAVEDLAWVSGAPPAESFQARTQIRYNHPAAASAVRITAEGGAIVEFETPQFAVAPGQAAVFYRDDEVLGGGRISDRHPAEVETSHATA
jgi:tRNA-specific 2-thiouridylase